jgi:dihydrofolate synthase/folylpolyglutamate synthase
MESRGIRMGVSRMHEALEYRGRPDRGQRFIHVAGTNGKGSVATLIASALSRAGYRTGLFTSPHLHRYVERVRIDGRPIAEREAARRITEILDAFERPGAPETTFFELTTLLAIETFRARECDVAVLEVGLGGRLDATNAVDSELAVITRIAVDHRRVLGDTLGAIAREKAGIIKRGVPLVCGVRESEPWRVIQRRARALEAPVSRIGRDVRVVPCGRRRFSVDLDGERGSRTVGELSLGLWGEHQRDNAALAVAALDRLAGRGLPVPDAAIRAGLRAARWPARIERRPGCPTFVFDAAHNPDGARALSQFLLNDDPWLRRRDRGRRVLVFGAMADKEHGEMLDILAPRFDRIVYCAPPIRRALPAAELARHWPGTVAPSVGDALSRARRSAGERGEVVVAGSIFVAAAARARVLGVRADPLIRM